MIWKWRCSRNADFAPHVRSVDERVKVTEGSTVGQALMMLLVGLLLGYSVLAATAPLHAQDHSTLTLAEYREKLGALRTEIDQSSSLSAPLAAAQKELSQVATVILPSGLTITVTSLLSNVVDSEIALQRIDTAIDQIDRSVNDHSETRLAQLQAILDRRFDNPLERWWDRFVRWLRDFFRQFERSSSPSQGMLATGQIAGWVVLIVAGVAIALLLGYWLQGLLGNFIAERRLNSDGNEDGLPTSAAAARQEAQQFAQTGNYREAVRRMYLAAMLALDENGLIRYDRTLTNREVLVQTEATAAVQAHLRPVVETFDEVWYGIHEPDQKIYQGYVTEIDQLEAMVKEK
ncbi:MAG: DUF4129 domain-containing protein [Caldilineaceae bacterium]